MNDTELRIDRMGRKSPMPASAFKKVLLSFTDGDISYADAQSDLQRLLAAGALPVELREVMRRCEMIAPLPEYAHVGLLSVLDELIERAAVLDPDPNSAPEQTRNTPDAPSLSPVSGPVTRPRPQSPEPIADPAQARVPTSHVALATPATIRPVAASATRRTVGLTPSETKNANALEEQIVRQEADYLALTQAYERAMNAGSAAAARATALAVDLAAVRGAMDAEQRKYRDIDKALAESIASNEAARARSDEARRASERDQQELRAVRASLAARDATLEQLQRTVREREERLAALQSEGATRATRASMDAAPAVELADARTALELEQSKSAELRTALAENVASGAAARVRAEELLRQSEQHRVEARTLRESLAARDQAILHARKAVRERESQIIAMQREQAQIVSAHESRADALAEDLASARTALGLEQSKNREIGEALAEKVTTEKAARLEREAALREHAKIAAALEERTNAMESELRVARAAGNAAVAKTGDDATLLLESQHGRGATPLWESGPEQPLNQAAKVQDLSLPWSRSRWSVGLSAAVLVLAVFVWSYAHHVPVPAHTAVSSADARPGTVIRDCPTCPAMTVVPAGRFKQGSLRAESVSASFEKPLHWVSIGRPFTISTNAVTVDEFRAFVTATGRDMRGCDTYDDKWRFKTEGGWENPGFVQSGLHPVTCVSWEDATAYVRWLSTTTAHRYRLPSAAEWEYAARAGGDAVQPWNSDGSGACANANVADQHAARRFPGWAIFACDDGYVYTAPVGSFKANAFGLHDMLGNVFQWTEDCWHPDYTGAPIDGSARTSGNCAERELRGGSWFTTPNFVRATYRNHFAVNYRASTLGIRVVRDIAP
jgi:formylglycine-generating enzyme required for sulfatase activity